MLQASVSSQNRATPDELVEIGKQLWDDVRNSGVDPSHEKESEALLARIQEKYKEFTQSFPLVVRWTVQLREFNARALKRYFLKHATASLETRAEFLELQAEYLVLLRQEKSPQRLTTKELAAYRKSVVDALKQEDELFTTTTKQVEEEFERRKQQFADERRQAVYAQLMRLRLAKADAGAAPSLQ